MSANILVHNARAVNMRAWVSSQHASGRAMATYVQTGLELAHGFYLIIYQFLFERLNLDSRMTIPGQKFVCDLNVAKRRIKSIIST